MDFVKDYKSEQIVGTTHTFARLNEPQRKIYTIDELREVINKEKPFLVGVQGNQNYAVFYNYKDKILKVILGFDNRKINIVTFYFINEWQIPKL